MKVGQILHYIGTEPDGSPSWETWVIRTIRGNKITAIWRLPHTWGKRSKKNGDYGWLDPIPAWCRKSWAADKQIPSWYGLFTTKRAAVTDAIKNFDPDDFDTPEQAETFATKVKRLRI